MRADGVPSFGPANDLAAQAGVPAEPHERLTLRLTDLEQRNTGTAQPAGGLGQDTAVHVQPIRPAAQGMRRLVVPCLTWQSGHLAGGDVRRAHRDHIQPSSNLVGDGLEKITSAHPAPRQILPSTVRCPPIEITHQDPGIWA